MIEMENNANANIMSEAKPEGPRVKDGSGSKSLDIIASIINVFRSHLPSPPSMYQNFAVIQL